jgi:hypothetical protein
VGWAADLSAASGGGVDVVQAYAYPLDTGGAPIFLGQADVNVARPDVASFAGAQFGQVGFNLSAPARAPGRYRVVAYGLSLVAGAFTASAMVDVIVR